MAHGLLMGVMSWGWRKLKPIKKSSSINQRTVSVLIPFRNEAKNLPGLLASLAQQDLQKIDLQVVLVDDHSDDQGPELIKKHPSFGSRFYLVHTKTDESGKKMALRAGLSHCTGEYILLSDADCIFPTGWIQSMITGFSDPACQLVQGPVALVSQNSLHARMQQIEFMSLMMSAAGSIGAKHPILASAANLGVRRTFYQKSINKLRPQVNTGDDMFLLEQAKKEGREAVSYIKSREALVQTTPASSPLALWNQRKRWSSKSINYQDHEIISTALIVWLTNALIPIGLVLVFCQVLPLFIPLSFWLVKGVFEWPLMNMGFTFYKLPRLAFWFWPTQLVYPFYIVLVSFSGVFGSFSWKGRMK